MPDGRFDGSPEALRYLCYTQQFERALRFISEALDFVGGEFYKRKDVEGAAKTLMLRRHPGLLVGSIPFLNEIDALLAATPDKYQHVGIARLEELVHDFIEEARKSQMKKA